MKIVIMIDEWHDYLLKIISCFLKLNKIFLNLFKLKKSIIKDCLNIIFVL